MTFTLNSIASDKSNLAAKRGDSIRVLLDSIKIVDGFNERDFKDDEVREHIASIAGSLAENKPVPALEVWVNPESGIIELVDGECRYWGYKGFAAEFPAKFDGYVSVVKFEGTPAQRKARVVSSNSQLKLKPVQIGRTYLSLRDEFGMTRQEIASEVGKSLAHVDQYLLLAGGSTEVHAAVEQGRISSTEATKLIRDHGDDAPAELERRLEAAKESGKDKVTAKVAPAKKSSTPSRPKVDMVVSNAVVLVRSLTADQVSACENPYGGSIVVDSLLLADLIMAVHDMQVNSRPLDADQQVELQLA